MLFLGLSVKVISSACDKIIFTSSFIIFIHLIFLSYCISTTNKRLNNSNGSFVSDEWVFQINDNDLGDQIDIFYYVERNVHLFFN